MGYAGQVQFEQSSNHSMSGQIKVAEYSANAECTELGFIGPLLFEGVKLQD